jgi:hypothetical protein
VNFCSVPHPSSPYLFLSTTASFLHQHSKHQGHSVHSPRRGDLFTICALGSERPKNTRSDISLHWSLVSPGLPWKFEPSRFRCELTLVTCLTATTDYNCLEGLSSFFRVLKLAYIGRQNPTLLASPGRRLVNFRCIAQCRGRPTQDGTCTGSFPCTNFSRLCERLQTTGLEGSHSNRLVKLAIFGCRLRLAGVSVIGLQCGGRKCVPCHAGFMTDVHPSNVTPCRFLSSFELSCHCGNSLCSLFLLSLFL